MPFTGAYRIASLYVQFRKVKHMRRSFLNKVSGLQLYQKRYPSPVFSCEFCEIILKSFFSPGDCLCDCEAKGTKNSSKNMLYKSKYLDRKTLIYLEFRKFEIKRLIG